MNKAFVKDDDHWDDPEIELDPQAGIPPGSRNYMTPRGADRLRNELDRLMHHDRAHLLAAINSLDHQNNSRDDAAHREARKNLQRLERRIAFLTGRLELTEVVDPVKQQGDTVRFGATVTVQPEDGPEMQYLIVGLDETDVNLGRISWTSPLARSMLNGRAGDVVKVRKPGGEENLEIVEVRYREIEPGG